MLLERAVASLQSGFATEPEVTATERALSRAVTAVATLMVALAAGYGLWAPIHSGHDAAVASMGIVADNMLRWHIAAPVLLPTDVAPDPSAYYCHHPFGIFWTTTLIAALFGNGDAVCRVAPLCASVASVPLVHAVGRELYRPAAAALGALAFACLPITMSFASFNALEVPLMAWSLVLLLGWLRFRRSRARRDLSLLVVGAVMATNTDWPAFILIAGLIAIELGALPARRWLSLRHVTATAWLAGVALVVGGAYLVAFHHWGKLGDLANSASARAGSPTQPLSSVLAARAYWIDLMFTPLGIAIGKAGAVIIVVGAVAKRRPELFVSIAVLGMCLAQYLLFRQGADVHVFWPHTFALFFALAVAALAAVLVAAIARLLPRSRPAVAACVALAVLVSALLPIASDALRALGWARLTGGRFNEKGAFIEADDDKVFVVRRVVSELAPDACVGMHASMAANWSTAWSLGGRSMRDLGMKRGEPLDCDVAFFDLRFVDPLDTLDILSSYDVELFGPYAVVREGEGFEALSLGEREATFSERLTVAPASPIFSVEPDPFATWEVAFQSGFDAPPPDDEPTTLEQIRVSHNIAVRLDDVAGAKEARARLLTAFEPRDLALGDVARVVGVRVEGSTSPRAIVLLEALRAAPAGVVPRISSRVVERAAFSITPKDPTARVVSAPPLVTPRSWRRGYLYSMIVRLLPRPGSERFDIGLAASVSSRAGRSSPPVELFTYP